MKQQIKVTLLEDLVVGIEATEKGKSNYWDILKDYGDSYLIENRHNKAIITKKELKAGEKHSEPNLSLPTGLHLKLEMVNKPSFWKRIFI